LENKIKAKKEKKEENRGEKKKEYDLLFVLQVVLLPKRKVMISN